VCARYVWSKHEKYPVNVVCLLHSGVGTVYGVRFLIWEVVTRGVSIYYLALSWPCYGFIRPPPAPPSPARTRALHARPGRPLQEKVYRSALRTSLLQN
jgi:hypothetical protein